MPLRLRLMDSVARIFRALGTRVEPAVPVRVESTRNRVLSNRDRAGLAWLQMLGRPWASRGDQPPTALGRALAAEFSTSLKKAQMPLHAFLGDPKGAGQLPGGRGVILEDFPARKSCRTGCGWFPSCRVRGWWRWDQTQGSFSGRPIG